MKSSDDQKNRESNSHSLFSNESKKNTSRFSRSSFSGSQSSDGLKLFIKRAYESLMERIDLIAANKMEPSQLRNEVERFIADFVTEEDMQLNAREQRRIALILVNDMIGLGPLEEPLEDDSITDILVNGFQKVYIERKGLLERIELSFHDETHLQQIARRIASRVGRRIDESSPMVDARLNDGSRVNIIIPPLSLDGTSISIRKFRKEDYTLDMLVTNGTCSQQIADFLKIVTKCRLNILISGGTGSGKTTLLNSLSQVIGSKERIITIEDSAELRLQQPHVVRLESRPPNIEGEGEVTIRDLVRNSLRMRPDRIIVGEVRGEETIDMLQAMNTGHDGSMSTIHANRPREALTRLENMMSMAGFEMPTHAIRAQIVGAINLVLHTERMRDGTRRLTQISEILGMESEIIVTHDLFIFEYEGDFGISEKGDAMIQGSFQSKGIMPQFMSRAKLFNLEKELKEVMRR